MPQAALLWRHKNWLESKTARFGRGLGGSGWSKAQMYLDSKEKM